MNTVIMNELYDQYGVLLTEKQRMYFEGYYFNDMSLSEIASSEGVSRNAVHKQLKDVEHKLEYYEENLKLNKIINDIKDIISLTTDERIKEKLLKIIE